ncbi:phosphotransferase [Pseudarthrobacter sp. J1738]|uniref:phosphotransferase n=1 Tax=unclassified Pseudarthrobacter TaxID=2647000 RepID=UPI003D2A0D63
MRRSPIELAAIATAAVPGLAPKAVAASADDAADFDSALLLDNEDKRWRVRSPKHPEASTRLETELLVLRAFAPAVRAELPFLMPTVAGTVRQGALTTFVYSHLAGYSVPVDEMAAAGDAMAADLATTLAAIHDLPHSLVDNADLPHYSAEQFRQRRLNELDQAATTGKIQSVLLRRWENALEDVTLWRFNPCVVHGDLHEDNILVEGTRVMAVTGWTDLRIGDPADDLAWLVAAQDQSFVDSVLRHYAASRRDQPDTQLLRRAALSAEFALAQYLVKALASEDPQMIAEAEDMLASLAADIEEEQRVEEEARLEARLQELAAHEPEPETALETETAAAVPSPAAEPPVAESPAAATVAVSAGAAAAVSVAPIPVEVESSEQDSDSEETTEPEAAHHDSTETAAISIIEAPKRS